MNLDNFRYGFRLGLLGLCLSVLACTINPYTNRPQLIMMPPAQEMSMGLQAFNQVLNDPNTQFSQNPKEIKPVERVVNRIIQAAKASKYAELANQFQWEVKVIKDDTVMNAFALPGGKIAVYTGIFPIAKNENGLAAILGHEVVHALARHGAERMSQSKLAEAAMTVASGVAEAKNIDPQFIQLAGGVFAKFGFILPYSRLHESEADYIGLLLAAQAGYDPREAIHVWERMAQATKGKGGKAEFLSTHPSHDTRIKDLQDKMPEALSFYHPIPGQTSLDLPRISQ